MPRFDQMVKGGSKPEAEEAEGSADDWLMHRRSDGTKFTTRQLRGPQQLEFSSYWLLESLFLGLRCLPETADYWQFLYASK